MADYLHTLLIAALTIWIYMTTWFMIAVLANRNDVADIAWGPGFVVTSLVILITSHNSSLQAVLVMVLVAIWGLRLSLHIGTRNLRKPEDFRYQAWRKQWGKWFYIRSYLQVFVLQGLLMLMIVSSPLLVITYATGGINSWVMLGVLVWAAGFVFESVGDQQLRRFVTNPKNAGSIMNQGLWRYTRHPNYFGEITQWWGLALTAVDLPYYYWAFVGPLTISFLIIKVSGIPLLEAKYQGNAKYEAYKRQTSMLIPWPPKQ